MNKIMDLWKQNTNACDAFLKEKYGPLTESHKWNYLH